MTIEEIEDYFKKEYNVTDLKTLDRVTWYWISAKYDFLTEEFIEKYIDKIDFVCISFTQILSEKFARKYHNKIYWEAFYQRKILEKHFTNNKEK